MEKVRKKAKRKVCLLGDPAVGKTSLIRRFVVGKYDDKYLSTLGSKVSKKTIDIEENGVSLTMMIWDLTGQKEFHQVHFAAYKNAAGALVVGDITRKETVDNVRNWISGLIDTSGQVPIVLLVNKHDLKDQAKVGRKYVEFLASRYNVHCAFTSAKTGENVEKAFHILGKLVTGAIETSPVPSDMYVSPERRVDINGISLLEIEDNLIMRFCEILGNTDFGMSIVRKQFSDTGVDFKNPTYQGLKKVVDRLVDAVRVFKGEKLAKEARKAFTAHLEAAKDRKD